VRQIALQNLVALWAPQDPAGSANWLQNLTENSLRKAGWSAYTQAIQQQEIPAANLPETLASATGPTSQRN
jgi:hypothetical protein